MQKVILVICVLNLIVWASILYVKARDLRETLVLKEKSIRLNREVDELKKSMPFQEKETLRVCTAYVQEKTDVLGATKIENCTKVEVKDNQLVIDIVDGGWYVYDTFYSVKCSPFRDYQETAHES